MQPYYPDDEPDADADDRGGRLMRVEVKAEHIREGRPDDAGRCPVALALHEATGKRCSATWRALFLDGACLPIPKDVQEFVCRFDYGQPVAPFAFDLEVPCPTQP